MWVIHSRRAVYIYPRGLLWKKPVKIRVKINVFSTGQIPTIRIDSPRLNAWMIGKVIQLFHKARLIKVSVRIEQISNDMQIEKWMYYLQYLHYWQSEKWPHLCCYFYSLVLSSIPVFIDWCTFHETFNSALYLIYEFILFMSRDIASCYFFFDHAHLR